MPEFDFAEAPFSSDKLSFQYDLSCFDFNKWKKCMNKILTEYPHLLMSKSDPQGENILRREISKYLYLSRGVTCSPSQIVIGAGTQQITGQLSLFLAKMSINHVAVEDPGYLPVKNIFRDRGFALTAVSVGQNGVDIKKLPENIKSAVYMCPSNQFPTGAVMPIGKRYELLEWAKRNNSIIIEDDYDSELRYFGKPIPALQGLDINESVVYLGSFSSTLYPSVRISYMVLPTRMAEIFNSIKDDYSQTCSKAEQLTLALFMGYGYYQTNIRKLRSLYSQKLQAILNSIKNHAQGLILPLNVSSGIYMIMNIKSKKSAETLCVEANSIGALVEPVSLYTDETIENPNQLIFYYNQIPLGQIDDCIKILATKWR
jgi:GntR family transcriptional regulator/MocR family aminotransferase